MLRLSFNSIETPLGPMWAVSDHEALYLLDFHHRQGSWEAVLALQRKMTAVLDQVLTPLPPGHPLNLIETELMAYFEGSLRTFKTPIQLLGTSFQRQAWHALQAIPYGQTRTYAQQAAGLSKPLSYRAVGNANGANRLSIIVPCHRVVGSHGLGGYGGGLDCKKWLLSHEQKHV